VTFEILPAIDVAEGRLVSASAGAVHRIEAFGGSPLAAAEAFVEAGARWLHVVDVDRANGRAPDLPLLSRIAALDVAVQTSGGIETPAAARDALDAGAGRVVLGSAVLADVEAVRRLVEALGDRCVLGIEADGQVIRPRSWSSDDLELPLAETLDAVRPLGVERYLYTGLARVAGLGGPDLAGIETAARILGRPVSAAGGIRGVEDVLAVRSLGPTVVDGCVVGRALYAGLGLAEIIATLR
jgi:phosphoribosylformimino-5-aminoimidazole carboxamide ribonucleotide (ProFAR) isomerase